MMEIDTRLNPFPGLRSFEEDEDYLFFGREKQTDELLKKLGNTHFLAVIGTSGSGKSSLVKSGLLPYLHCGYMSKAGSSWKVAVSRPGNDPIGNMARSMASAAVLYDYEDESDESMYAAIIESTLRRSSLGLSETVKQSQLPAHENLLIVIDQFEELFRFDRYEKKNQEGKRDSLHFISLLLAASQQRHVPIYIVFTMRSDFLGECTQFRGLAEAINEGQYLIPRMTRDEQRTAITGPVAVGGASITPRLLTRLLNDVGDNPDQLPILQHSLMRTWDYWESNHENDEPIDLHHYEAIGTMNKALSLHAEEAFNQLSTDRERRLCEMLFKSLTDKGAGGQGIRRPCKLSEICSIAGATSDEVIPIIEVFRKPGISFLMPPSNIPIEHDSIIDISHESLMRVWTRLIGWADEESQSAEVYLRLSEAAALYHEGKTQLWTGPELQLTLNWKEEYQPNEIWANRYDHYYERAFLFLDYSKKAQETAIEEKEKRRKAVLRRTRWFASVLGIAFLISILILIYAVDQQQKAQQSEEVALRERDRAEQEKQTADLMRIAAEESRVEAETAKVEALNQKDIAISEKERAERLKVEADYAKDKAVKAKIEADELRIVAETQKERAERLRIEADQQKQDAIRQKDLAEKRKEEADRAKTKAERLRLLEVGQSIALQTLRIDKEKNADLAALLAYTSFHFNEKYEGEKNNPDIFNALVYAAENRDEQVFDEHEDAVREVAYDRTGNLIASGGDDGKLIVWNYNSKKPEHIFKIPGRNRYNIRALEFSRKWIIAGTVDGALLAWPKNGDDNDPLPLQDKGSPIRAIAVDPIDGSLVAGSDDGKVILWRNGNLMAQGDTILEVGHRINDISFVGGQNQIVLGCHDGTILHANLEGSTILSLKMKVPIYSVAVSEVDGSLAAGGNNGDIHLWRGNTWQSDAVTLRAHASAVNDLEFTKDGATLASVGADGLVKLWVTNNPNSEPRVLSGHNSWTWDIALSPDGNRLISGGSDNHVRSWNINVDDLASGLCKKAGRSLSKDEWVDYVGADVEYEETCKD